MTCNNRGTLGNYVFYVVCAELLVAPHCTQLKTRTQIVGEPLQVFSTTTEQLTHHDLRALHGDHICRGAGKAFTDGRRE
jgi:hypothetical protein